MGLTYNTPMGYPTYMKGKQLQTVVETPEFIKQAKECMDDEVRTDFINFIANNPTSGDLIQGTGGARKIRWQSNKYSGKSGGVRVIYYYHDEEMPIFLFTVYKKNQRENITSSEKLALSKIIKLIVKAYKE
jgi:mRNA-degrading endonuclease RelE of RelBE toxin-antitoxin system